MTCVKREVRDRLSEAQNHRCCYCGVRFDEGGPNSIATIEHVRPRASGGRNSQDNLAVACYRCNNMRGSMNAYRFCQQQRWRWKSLSERGRLPDDWQPLPAERTTIAAVWPRH